MESQQTNETRIEKGDRVRIDIPHPDDAPEVDSYQRDIAARYTAVRDHLRYNCRRGTVVHIDCFRTAKYTVEFDDPEDTLSENPPNITFLAKDLVLLNSSGDDKAVMPSTGAIIDPKDSVVANADRIIRKQQKSLFISATQADGEAPKSEAIALELNTRLSEEPEPDVKEPDPRGHHPDEEIVAATDDILERKANNLLAEYGNWDRSKKHTVMVTEELKSRLKRGGDE